MNEEKTTKCPWCLQSVTQLENHRRQCLEKPTSSKSYPSISLNDQTEGDANNDDLSHGNVKDENPKVNSILSECHSLKETSERHSLKKSSEKKNVICSILGVESVPAASIGDDGCITTNSAVHSQLQSSRVTPKRKQWSVGEKNELMTCYVQALPHTRGWTNRIIPIWNARGNPEAHEKYLTNQIRAILKRGEYSEFQLSRLVKNNDDPHNEPATSPATASGSPENEIISEDSIVEIPLPTRTEDAVNTMNDNILREIDQEISTNDNLDKEYIRPLKRVSQIKLKQRVHAINESLQNLPRVADLMSVVRICKAVAKIVTREFSQSTEEVATQERGGEVKQHHIIKPKWLSRIERKMTDLYKDIDRLKKYDKLSHRKKLVLSKKYQVNQSNVKEIIEICEQKLSALKGRKIRYTKQATKRKQNTLFRYDRKKLFNEILGKGRNDESPPDPHKCEDFWKNIWGTDEKHESMDWIIAKVSKMNENKEQQINHIISLNELKDQLRKTANWKAPGIDGLHPFWIKNLTTLHQRLVELMNESLIKGVDPFITTGRTVLIQKDKNKGNAPSNYRPITCLSIVWKTLTGIISAKIYDHLVKNNMIPEMQKGCIRKSRATKDQLIIDQEIMEDAKKRQKNLSMGWIDFQKAYDMVPHSWIIETLKLYRVSEIFINFLQQSMKNWNLWLYCNGKQLCNITVKRGIFQGDSLSPLLFIMTLFPLSDVVLNKTWGYQMKLSDESEPEGITVNHLLYMDDIKLYAKSVAQLKKMIAEVKIFSDQMKMKFGLDKCKTVHIVRGKLKEDSQVLLLPPGDHIEALCNKDDRYKYLGIMQLNTNKHQEMKASIKQEYCKRVRAVLQSELSAKNKITSINSLAIPVIRYSGGIIHWNKTELQEMDIKTRKLLTCYRGFAKRSNVTRLYLKRQYGGRGLISVEECVRKEESSLSEYRSKSLQPVLRKCHSATQQASYQQDASQNDALKKWREKPLHGQYIRQLDKDIDLKLTFLWLARGTLSIETEGFICAAQEQAIVTRAIASHIHGANISDQCRLCGNAVETTMHILAECSKIAQQEYLDRHNQVAKYIHWRLLQNNGIQTEAKNWKLHEPHKIAEADNIKILWDFNIFTDRKIQARRPDIVIINKTDKTGMIIDINCPNDSNVCKNEKEKCCKYTDLKIELERIWDTHFDIIPIVIGCLGATSKRITKFIQRIGLRNEEISQLQEMTLLSSCHILRRYITQSGLQVI
jgi:hypothetical protein